MKLLLPGLCLLLSLSLELPEARGPRPLPISEKPEIQNRFTAGLELHQLAVAGSRPEVRRAREWFEALHKDAPDDPRIQAFYGNLVIMEAREAPLLTRPRWLKRGLRILDQAVERAPDDPHVRAVRAINHSHLPGFVGRTSLGREDFAWLFTYFEDAENQARERELHKFILFQFARFVLSDEPEAARQALQQAMDIPAESVDNTLITLLLKSIS
jgi:hypothetical protein